MSDSDDEGGLSPDADPGPGAEGAGTADGEAPSNDGTPPRDAAGDDPAADASAREPSTAADADDAGGALENAPVGEAQELDPRVRYHWLLGTTIGAVVLAVTVGVGAFLWAEQYVWVAGVAFAALFVYGIARAVLLYRSWHYVVRDDSLYLHRGVLTRVQTVVPYVRVQHIDTRRSATERLLGLSSLVVYTAGSRGADVTIPGLTPERADLLQTRLKRLAIESEDEDAV